MTGTTPPTPNPDAKKPRGAGDVGTGPTKDPSPAPSAPARESAGPQASKYSMADLLIGTVLADRYRLETKVGEGRIKTQPGEFAIAGEGLCIGRDPKGAAHAVEPRAGREARRRLGEPAKGLHGSLAGRGA